MMSEMSGSWCGLRWAVLVVVLAGCDAAPKTTTETGTVQGQVVVSGPLHGALVAVDQVKLDARGEIVLREHVGEATTDSEGRFSLDAGVYSGLFVVTASGGSYRERVGGAMVQLDEAEGIESIAWLDLLEDRDDVLVSPVGHLIAARMRTRVAELGDVSEAATEASETLGKHFANVDWTRIKVGSLDVPAVSPTEPVRAALVQAALSVLASDIANQAGASSQDVNVLELTHQLASDLSDGVFDGNDNNDEAPGSGLQVGVCAPIEGCTVPASGCELGACRSRCDLYANTLRALLAGEMTKVIFDNGPGGINQTQLSVADILPVARSVADNLDEQLFGAACPDTLDRVAPSVAILEPAEGSFHRGSISMRATAIDDTDSSPNVSIVGHQDIDGDPTNASAQATIDISSLNGTIVLQAAAEDQAGNKSTAMRTIVADNLPPELSLSAAGYFVDGATWWTTSATPTLTGTVSDITPVSIRATASGIEIPGAVTGATFTIAIPSGAVPAAGTDVTIIATDAPGNTRTIVQRIRPDTSPPEISFQASVVLDEAAELVAFDETSHVPIHSHTGTPVDLAGAGCPTLTKYSYLLGASAPVYGVENPGRNPILYQLVTSDPGVGIGGGSTQYRVGRRNGATTDWLVDWTSTGSGTVLGAGVTRYGVGIYADVVASVATNEGTYDVQFRTTDRLSRATSASKCFELRLKAPPLELPPVLATTHPYKLDSLRLDTSDPTLDNIAARLLNEDATGASLLDKDFINGTGETVYLTVAVTKPTDVISSARFVIRHAQLGKTTVSVSCGVEVPEPGNPCYAPPSNDYTSPTLTLQQSTLAFPVRVFEVGANGYPTSEVPCVAPCPANGASFKFAIPPRAAGNAPAKRYKAMAMIGKVASLRPTDGTRPAAPPYVDAALGPPAGPRITGTIAPPLGVFCVRSRIVSTDPDTGEPTEIRCTERATLQPYRALTSVGLSFIGDLNTTYLTAPTASLDAAVVTTGSRSAFTGWTTTESSLP